jgi:hypothetical protein
MSRIKNKKDNDDDKGKEKLIQYYIGKIFDIDMGSAYEYINFFAA